MLRYWLGLDLDDAQAMPPHRARPDAYVTAHILCALLNVASLEDMISWTSEPRAMAACPIGKHKGKPWAEIDRGYLTWMVGSDMKDDLKWNAQRELDRRATEAA